MKLPRWLRWRSNAELDEELQTHLDLEIQANLDRGLSPDEARSAAARRFGNPTLVKERAREADPFSRLEIFLKDLRYGLRSLVRAPGLAIAALLTLALGIGANAAIYQLFDAILRRPLPVHSPQELVVVGPVDASQVDRRRARAGTILSNPVWEWFRDHQQIFQGVLAWTTGGLRVGADGDTPVARGLFVSGEFFNVLGVDALLGQTFAAADDRPGCGVPGAVLSHDFWQRQYGGDPALIGQAVALNSQQVRILGVTPEGFAGLEVGRTFDVAVPLCSHRVLGAEKDWLDDGMTWLVTVMGRLGPGQTAGSANAALGVLSPSIFEATLPPAYPADAIDEYRNLRLQATAGATGISALRNPYDDPLRFLLVTTGLVLLLACANLANLILARSSAREHEFAVRRAVGASSGRLVRQSMIESALLALGGAAAGLVLAAVLSRFLVGFLGNGLSLELPVDFRMVFYIVGMAALACLTFGAIPAWRASRPAPVDAIKEHRSGSSGSRVLGLRQALVVSQIAVSLVLVFGAVLFAGTLRNLLLIDTGFEPDGVLVARVDYDALEIPQESRAAFKRDVLDRIASVPGVGSAAEVRHVPMGGTGTSVAVVLDSADGTAREGLAFNLVTEGFLETMGIPRIAGRDFERRDHGTRVAIVNRTFAGRLGLENPVGATFRAEAHWIKGSPDVVFEIVGYVPDTKYSDQREESQPIAFIPFGVIPDPRPLTDFMIRSTLPASAAAAAVKGVVRDVSPRIRTDIRPFNDTILDRLLPQRLLATLAGFFGVLAVLVAAVGLYGVMSYLVVRRTKEIGVRIALGATRKNIMGLVLSHAARLLIIGCVVGSLLAFGAAGLVQSLVFGLEARSIAPVGLACILFSFVAALACYLPAARAANVDPREALRRE